MSYENEENLSPSLEERRRKERKHRKKVGRGMYVFSLAVWGINLLAVLFCPFFGAEGVSTVVFLFTFAVVILQGIATGAFEGEYVQDAELVPKRFFDRCLFAVGAVALFASVIGMGISMLNGGGPDMIDGGYYIVSHGDTVREINELEYRIFAYIEQMFMSCGILFFCTYMFCNVRYLYRLHYEE